MGRKKILYEYIDHSRKMVVELGGTNDGLKCDISKKELVV